MNKVAVCVCLAYTEEWDAIIKKCVEWIILNESNLISVYNQPGLQFSVAFLSLIFQHNAHVFFFSFTLFINLKKKKSGKDY